MSTERFFEITWNDMAVVIGVNTSVLTPDVATEINEFLSSPDSRLRQCDGDVYVVVARMFASYFFRWAIEQGGIMGEYGGSYDGWVKSTLAWVNEGWPAYKECGIRIVSADADVDLPSFDSVDAFEMDRENT